MEAMIEKKSPKRKRIKIPSGSKFIKTHESRVSRQQYLMLTEPNQYSPILQPSRKSNEFHPIIHDSREKVTDVRTIRDSFRGKKVGTGDSPEIGEMSPETGPGWMLLLGISEESDAKRNRNLKTTSLVWLACTCFLLNENLVVT